MSRDLPIIVMSGGLRKAGPGLLDEATELGANASLKKPFRIAEVRQAVNAQLGWPRSEEHTSELQSLMRISYAVFCLKKKNNHNLHNQRDNSPHCSHQIT